MFAFWYVVPPSSPSVTPCVFGVGEHARGVAPLTQRELPRERLQSDTDPVPCQKQTKPDHPINDMEAPAGMRVSIVRTLHSGAVPLPNLHQQHNPNGGERGARTSKVWVPFATSLQSPRLEVPSQPSQLLWSQGIPTSVAPSRTLVPLPGLTD